MFLKVVNVLAELFGPALILLGAAGWFTGRIAHAFPGSAAMPLIGVVISVIALFAALEEKKRINAIALGLACVAGAAFAVWTHVA